MTAAERCWELSGTTGQTHSLSLFPVTATWAQLVAICGTHRVGPKDGEALISATFKPCPPECRNAAKPDSLSCGGGKPHRLAANVAAMSALGADLDDVPEDDFWEAFDKLEGVGLSFLWWHTHSHKPGGKVRARILIPFEAPLPLPFPNYWAREAWPRLIGAVGLDSLAAADRFCRDAARIYFLPRKPDAQSDHRAGFVLGESFLDWRPILGKLPDAIDIGTIAPGEEDSARPVDMDDLRKRLKKTKRHDLEPLIERLLAGEALSPHPSKRAPAGLPREPAWQKTTMQIAMYLHEWESSNAVLRLCEPSWRAEVAEAAAAGAPGDHTDWEHVKELLANARAKAPTIKARADAEREQFRKTFMQTIGRAHGNTPQIARPAPPAPEVAAANPTQAAPAVPAAAARPANSLPASAAVASATASDNDDPDAWRDLLVTESTKDGFRLKNCAANAATIIEHAPEWRGAIRFNALKFQAELWGGPLNPSGVPRPIGDHDTEAISNWLQRAEYELNLPSHVIDRQIDLVARAHVYDPLRDYLAGLKDKGVWDGVPRLDTMLEQYFKVRTKNGDRDITPYVRAVSARFMLASVARGLEPGAKVDTILGLEGLQGAKKSTAVRVLGGGSAKAGGMSCDTALSFTDKDLYSICATHWFIELGEMTSFNKSDLAAQKRFITLQEDTFRPPYGRRNITTERRSVFISTVNAGDYLNDVTGNRRYWPVYVDDAADIDIAGLARDRDQLFAEAVARFYQAARPEDAQGDGASRPALASGERWWFDRAADADLIKLAELEQTARMSAEPLCEAIYDWFLRKPEAARPERLTTLQIASEVLTHNDPTNQGLAARIGRALIRMGFSRHQESRHRRTIYYYKPPKELLTEPQALRAPSGAMLKAADKAAGHG